ncbi:hypothetical protein FHG66_07880 [Rubellimicrobium rubrum]|uniref:Type I secretion protein n=1 Tax=Rubellimicrobium rubrum TaxID=2585369 RepID=A0A5C4N0I4_9RHOB|nr:hypothetical protein [Rubellimicrobium rubrum]TNC50411.1 hypothetical protein FHG66_07880 [Rubellimicrobium rubrum]
MRWWGNSLISIWHNGGRFNVFTIGKSQRPRAIAWIAGAWILVWAPLAAYAIPSFPGHLGTGQVDIRGEPRTAHGFQPSSFSRPSWLQRETLVNVAADAAPDGTVQDPSLGVNLGDVTDWSTELPFLDLMRSSRPWVAHEEGVWGAWSNERLATEGYLSPEGWPQRLPDGSTGFQTAVLTEQPEEARSIAGTYLLRWEGSATVTLDGLVENIRPEDGAIRFTFAPDKAGAVLIGVTNLDAADPFRNMTLVREDRAALLEGGAVFNPDFLARIQDFRALRFMDWMKTNNSTQRAWEDRPQVTDASWMQRGVPVEIMVQLANEVGADPWFTLPHQADDDYVARFSSYVRDHLDPGLKVYAEWSNEVWNFAFEQTHWAAAQATERWGVAPGGDGFIQFAGVRASEVADIWQTAFGPEAESRLIRVIGTQTGWKGLEVPLLDAPLGVAEGRRPPAESFDAYAVTGYFGHGIGSEDMAPQLLEWLDRGTAVAEVTELARSDLQQLVEDFWPYHQQIARDRNLTLVAYEGGTHIVGHGPVMEDADITQFFTSYSYTPEMGALYGVLLTEWAQLGAGLFTAYSGISSPSRYGSWGALRHLDDSNPRWDALVAANAIAAGWEDRDPSVFRNGVIRLGSDHGETLTGTPEEDDLIALDGDDILIPLGGGDRLHGGPGEDIVRLPGALSDWTKASDGLATVLQQGTEIVRLTAVEVVEFQGSGDRMIITGPD